MATTHTTHGSGENHADADAAREAAEDTLVALGNTELVAKGWRPDGEGAVPDGIVGGDGAGEALSVRYLNRHLPHAQITAYFHVVDLRDRNSDREDEPFPFFVEEMVEYYVADRPVTDEDVNEKWSDYDYHGFSGCYATEAEAEVERDRLAAADRAEDYYWDGSRK